MQDFFSIYHQKMKTIWHLTGALHLLCLLAYLLAVERCHIFVAANPLHGFNDNSLTLSLSTSNSIATQQNPSHLVRSNPTEKIMSDDVTNDFELSMTAVSLMTSGLESFANAQLQNVQGKQDNLISNWLKSKGLQISDSQPIIELDYIYAKFWTKLRPLVERFIHEKPGQLSLDDLDFRCKKMTELYELKQIAASSSLFRIFSDTFFSEVYTHCLQRKLALIKYKNINPSQLLRQFVDVYLDFPTKFGPLGMLNWEQDPTQAQTLARLALNFNLDEALARHGSLREAAGLVFDHRTALSFGLSADVNNIERLVHQFGDDCHDLTTRLSKIWDDFDNLAQQLSSPMSNLAAVNERIKFAAPQLVYGTICSQLIQSPDQF